ncbi:MAG: hypothetical protein ACI4L1_01450 [Christensenellales bacterium]
MEINKQTFIEKLEDVSNKFFNKIDILVKDISDVILFLSIYCGEKNVSAKQIQIQMKGLNTPKILKPEFNKDGSEKKRKQVGEPAVLYKTLSYDEIFLLEVIMGKRYLKIEKKSIDESNLFCVEYIFAENGEFLRIAHQKSFLLGKEVDLEEKSNGSLKRDIVLSTIKNNSENLETEFFKVETKNDAEIFYRYNIDGEINFCYKAINEKYIPSISSIGMKSLNMFFEKQFDDKFEKIDENFFKSVKNQVKELFRKENE